MRRERRERKMQRGEGKERDRGREEAERLRETKRDRDREIHTEQKDRDIKRGGGERSKLKLLDATLQSAHEPLLQFPPGGGGCLRASVSLFRDAPPPNCSRGSWKVLRGGDSGASPAPWARTASATRARAGSIFTRTPLKIVTARLRSGARNSGLQIRQRRLSASGERKAPGRRPRGHRGQPYPDLHPHPASPPTHPGTVRSCICLSI